MGVHTGVYVFLTCVTHLWLIYTQIAKIPILITSEWEKCHISKDDKFSGTACRNVLEIIWQFTFFSQKYFFQTMNYPKELSVCLILEQIKNYTGKYHLQTTRLTIINVSQILNLASFITKLMEFEKKLFTLTYSRRQTCCCRTTEKYQNCQNVAQRNNTRVRLEHFN